MYASKVSASDAINLPLHKIKVKSFFTSPIKIMQHLSEAIALQEQFQS
jgi:hypothetical protein